MSDTGEAKARAAIVPRVAEIKEVRFDFRHTTGIGEILRLIHLIQSRDDGWIVTTLVATMEREVR